MKKFWALFFFFWPTVAIYCLLMAPSRGWWFPSAPMSRTGVQIDGLFYLILIIVSITFVGTQYALGYVLWMGATKDSGNKAHLLTWQSQAGNHLDDRAVVYSGVYFAVAAGCSGGNPRDFEVP